MSSEIVDEARRLTRQMLDDAAHHRQKNALELNDLKQRTFQRLRQTVENVKQQVDQHLEKQTVPPQKDESSPDAEVSGENRDRDQLVGEGDVRQRQEAIFRPPGVDTSRAGADELLDHREAVARSVAARRAQNIVTPIDDDGDDEARYYRRGSWLV